MWLVCLFGGDATLCGEIVTTTRIVSAFVFAVLIAEFARAGADARTAPSPIASFDLTEIAPGNYVHYGTHEERSPRNLGDNAAKYTAHGSVVLRAYRDGSTVTLEVEDSGPGISPEVQRHVFDRFYRGERDAHGFGLGLAIVRESVRTLGGRIELDSSPGEGTVFRILLVPARVREEVPAA